MARVDGQHDDPHEAPSPDDLVAFDRDQRARGQDDQDSSPPLSPEDADPLDHVKDRVRECSGLDPELLAPVQARQPGDHGMNECVLGIEPKTADDRLRA